jgi:hypothetical protein
MRIAPREQAARRAENAPPGEGGATSWDKFRETPGPYRADVTV